MKSKPIKERLVENEAVFRKYNEQVQESIDELKLLAKESGMNNLAEEELEALKFFCECSDENCKERVRLDPQKYQEIHRDRKKFVMIAGHEVPQIEEVIAKENGYNIVRKKLVVPKDPGNLNDTPIQNV